MNSDTLKSAVQTRYGNAAKEVLRGKAASCCGAAEGSGAGSDPITSNLYSSDQAQAVPADALLASLGCGNPTALAELKPGETVLDLGSGGGIDVLLSAKRVGPAGKAYGLDMTPEMLELARRNQQQAGVPNAEFLQGTIESIPLPEGAVDVIISNCVINLSGDKGRVLREAFRVLKPGGRFAVSDIVVRRELPPQVRESLALWTGCIAGALQDREYAELLRQAGFEAVEIEPTRIYTRADMEDRAFSRAVADPGAMAAALDGAVMSAFIRARKPLAAAPGAATREAATPGTAPQPQAGPRAASSACCGGTAPQASTQAAAPARATSGCCGGAAPASVEACCVEDAAAKAAGASGCGCGSASRVGR